MSASLAELRGWRSLPPLRRPSRLTSRLSRPCQRNVSYLSSYPRPSTTSPPTSPRLFIPLQAPPSAEPPHLSLLDRNSPLDGFKFSRHVFQAAYPRSSEGSAVDPSHAVKRNDDPFGPVSSKDKKERKSLIKKAAENTVKARLEARRRYESPTSINEPGMYIAANRFLRKNPASQSTGLTLFCVHANGFHKEEWEPTFQRLLRLEKDAPVDAPRIDEIWMMDIATHGESFALNEGVVGPITDWLDVGRDILSALEHCIPSERIEALPTFLPFDESMSPKKRKIIGIGHSVGGNGIVQAAHARPDLFESLILVDPITREISDTDKMFSPQLIASCIGRRDVWSSRKEARDNLLLSPFFAAWHPDVFTTLIRYGLVTLSSPPRAGSELEDEASSGPVTLACPRWAEASLFADIEGGQTGWNKLEYLRDDMKVKFVMAGDSYNTGGPERTRALVWRPKGASNVIIKTAGHLITQEKPELLAIEMAKAIYGGKWEDAVDGAEDKGKL